MYPAIIAQYKNMFQKEPLINILLQNMCLSKSFEQLKVPVTALEPLW